MPVVVGLSVVGGFVIRRVFKYHGAGRFVDDLCAINDANEFSNSFKYIYFF